MKAEIDNMTFKAYSEDVVYMSADLFVFDESKAPVEPMEFLTWFYEKTT